MQLEDKGFTLIEVLVAFTILGVAFSVLFYLQSQAVKILERDKALWKNFLYASNNIKEGKLTNLSVEKIRLPESGVILYKIQYRDLIFYEISK